MISLSFTYKEGGYKCKGYSFRVDSEKFNKFPVFDTFKFTIKGGKPLPLVEFKISDDKSVHYYHSSGGKINSSEIIYSKSNPNEPLVYGIKSGRKTNYYKHSSVKDKFYYKALGLSPSEDVADSLIHENDYVNDKVTFRVDKKERYNNIGLIKSRKIGRRYNEYRKIYK